MLLKRKRFPELTGLLVLILQLSLPDQYVNAAPTHSNLPLAIPDTTPVNYKDSLHYPIYDRRNEFLGGQKSTYDFSKPSNMKDSIVYDAKTRRYTVYEKIGNRYYRSPNTFTYEEFWKLRGKQAEAEYFKRRANTLNILNRKTGVKPRLNLYDNLFNRLFGNGKINITPQGNVDITTGYQGQNIKNPTLPEKARKNGGFDFAMNAQVNVNANIGDKLKFPINYNTLANLDFDNQLKLDYSGSDDEIIKRLEAGNVSFPSRATLIPGAQQLFGLKTQLQFGKLFLTAVFANQKSTRQSANLQGGSASQQFEIKADEYEENRHFLLAQYFKTNYNKVMKNLPAVTTPVQILRLEVWVTNRNGTTTETRDIVGFMDLGESQPGVVNPVNPGIPYNDANTLFAQLRSNPGNRNPALVYNNLISGTPALRPVEQFEKTFARKLDSTQYIFNRQAGFISLSQPLQTDEVLAVAYQYSYNGKIYQVGEFSQDLPPDSASATQKILFLKLLKSTSQRTTLPLWGLMMKNVYSVGYGTLTPSDFKLDVLYQEPALGWKRYVPFGNKNLGAPIISLINVDRLNNQLDPQPDGVFDFVPGWTIIPEYSRVVFPVLEPFGRDLANQVYNAPLPATAKDTFYYALYDSIKAVALQYPNLNRFVLKGSAKTSGSSDISIGYNIPKGSVSVSAGGRQLQEGVDYDINYDLGTIKIINQAIVNAGQQVQVNFENNASYGIQQKNYIGLRLDYQAINNAKTQLSFGGTLVRLGERPFFTKVAYDNNNAGGTNEPIRNTMYGADINYRKEMPRLTKLLDKLPFYQTKAPSNINVYAEAAYLKPSHAPQIGKGNNGLIYIDDFEGTKSGIDLRFPPIAWALASTPLGATDRFGNLLFPEATLNDNIAYGKNRAQLAWYQIEPTLQQYKGQNNPFSNDKAELSDPRVRQVYQKEIFPQKTTGFGESQLQTFDLSYYPYQRGPYNYDDAPLSVATDGRLLNPKKRWGGLMRSIDQPDFETGNVEAIEFWMQDPFTRNPASSGGKMYINLGNVSEDILKDGRRFYENGLPTPNAPAAPVDRTNWGKVPRNPIQVTNAFSNDPADREFQDLGLDGMNDDSEQVKRANYISNLKQFVTSAALAKVNADPSSDDYMHYRNDAFTPADGILKRYKNFNNTQGNSPVATTGSDISAAATLYPDAEDLNRDNTLNQTEEYFQYIVDIKPPTDPLMVVGQNFIVDKKTVQINTTPDGITKPEIWYQFRIPINEYNLKVGNIPDFKSIRFIRMFLTDFSDSVTMRFGLLQLSRNIWRTFKYRIDSSTTFTSITPGATTFNVSAVNIEENDQRQPLPYRTPREIQRVQTLSNNGVNLLQNEQSLSMQFCNLTKADARGVFQTFANRDLRQFGKLSMFIHAEQKEKTIPVLKDKDLTAVVRIGNDFTSNYYEVRIPLNLTSLDADTRFGPESDQYNDSLWNPANSLEVDLQTLVRLKESRNLSNFSVIQVFRKLQSNGHVYSVMGSPNLAEITGILIGIENTNASSACGEVWVNELRLSSLDEQGGAAALVRVDWTLADLGTISLSGNAHTKNWGTLEQRINERARENFYQFDMAANLQLGKLLPKKWGVEIPFYGGYTQTVSTPEYDPYDKDQKLKDKLKTTSNKDSVRNNAIDFTSTKTLNFTNVRKAKTGSGKPKIYDISNVDVSYSYIQTKSHNPLVENNEVTRHRGGLGYNFAPQAKYIEPFKKIFKKTKTHWFDLIKDANINLVPTQLSFKADIQRQFGAIRPRSVGVSKYFIPETYDKYFTFQRDYIMRWPLTRSINFDFTATNNSRVDEPIGRIDTKPKKDTVWKNLMKGGRNTLYNHTANFSYTLPTAKFPLIDWTTANIKYQATYKWIGASRLAVELGNILENGQQEEATLQMDFTKLYQKSKWLRQLEQPANKDDKEKWKKRITVTRDSVTLKSGKKVFKKIRTVDKTAMPYVAGAGRGFLKLLTSLKQANISLSENSNTRLPGYTDSTQYLGQNWKSMAPGMDFILGRQPDSNWINSKASKGQITKDTTFNSLFTQNYDQRLTLSATLEPIRDLTITVNLSKTFSKNFSETFKYADTTGNGINYKFHHLNGYAGGGFDISYISYKTLFGKFDPNQVSETFKLFQANRKTLSSRLGKLNPYTNGATSADGYNIGYGKYSVDVLVPAFIAAYTGQSPDNVALVKQSNPNIKSNPFRAIIPKPNWKIDYNGLTRIKGLEKIFTNFTLSHGYTSNLSMNGFTSALLYQDVSRFGYPSFIDTSSKNYIPYYLVPNVTISEQFSPLIGVDMMFTNQLQAKFEYAKSRTLSLSLVDFQLSEQRSTEFTVGAGYRKKGMKLPLNIPLPKFLRAKDDSKNASSKFENEINFRLDFKIRDNVTANSRLDQDNNFATAGSKEVTISPTIDYFLSQRVNVKLYFDQRRITPYISSSAPVTNTRAGLQVRISLAQ